MTTLGKIMVFANLVFSFVTGALIIMVFITRTNWKAGYDDMYKKLQVAQAEAKAYKDQIDVARNEENAKLKDAQAKLTAAESARDGFKTQLDGAQTKANEEKARADAAVAQAAASSQEAQRRGEELKQQQEIVAQRNQKINELEFGKDKNDTNNIRYWRERSVGFEIALNSEKERANNLVTQVQTMAKEMERIRSNGGGGAPTAPSAATAKNPPAEDVRGRITATDPDTGLVTVSLGSDAGIAKGNTLEVYRLKPKPTYLGTIRIIDVQAHQAVGRPITPQRRGLIQRDDEVAANILGNR